MIKKLITMVALLGTVTLVQANSYSNNYTLASGLNCNNSSYNCSVPISSIASGYQVSDCIFTFSSCNTQSHSKGYFSCDLFGTGTSCTLGSQHGSTQTWTCTLDSDQIACMNQCLASGLCNFGISCQGNWNIGSCSVSYNCTKKREVPDGSTTLYLLGAALVGIELIRRQMVPALARIKK
jgi:hypothetical protein